MPRAITAFFLLLALSAPLYAVTPQIFPDDYKPTTCDVKEICASFRRVDVTSAGMSMQGYTNLREAWIDAHWDKLLSEIKPYCAKLATCYATAGNTSMFCNDVVLTMMMGVCDQYPQKSDDHDQCFLLMRIYATGIDLKAWKTWEEAQACTKANAATPAAPRQLEVTMTPKTLPLDFNGKVVIYALDKETRVPVRALISVDGEILFARDAPDGIPTTSYALPWKAKLQRSGGEVVAPMVTVTRDGYEPVKFRMPVDVRPMTVTMTPSQNQLKRGKNVVTITAKDSVTGQPIDARVLIGQRDVAEANQPFELELKRGEKRAEIRVRSSFDRYSDVVVAPAER